MCGIVGIDHVVPCLRLALHTVGVDAVETSSMPALKFTRQRNTAMNVRGDDVDELAVMTRNRMARDGKSTTLIEHHTVITVNISNAIANTDALPPTFMMLWVVKTILALLMAMSCLVTMLKVLVPGAVALCYEDLSETPDTRSLGSLLLELPTLRALKYEVGNSCHRCRRHEGAVLLRPARAGSSC